MNLIERSHPDYLQSYIKTDSNGCENNIKLLLKLNLLSRLYKSIKNDLSESDISKDIIPKLKLKIIKVQPEGKTSGMYIGNLNKPYEDNSLKDKAISDEIESKFSDLDISMPSVRILSDRLYSFGNEEYLVDPFRLTNLEVNKLDIDFSDVNYNYLKCSEDLFIDKFYSGYDYNKKLYYDKVRSTYIITLNDIIENDPTWKLTPSKLDELVKGISDNTFREDIKKSIRLYMDKPMDRNRQLLEAKKVIELSDVKDKEGKPISTWKIVAGVSVVILSILAILNRKAFVRANKLASEAKKNSKSGVKEFVKSFFTPTGRSTARDFMDYASNISTYKEDSIRRTASRDIAKSRLSNIKESKGWT